MAKFDKKIEALELRRKGMSIKAIANKLDVSKSSVSVWCGDIKLTDGQKKNLLSNMIKAGNKGRMIGAEMNRKKKIDQINFYRDLGKKDVGLMSKRDFFIAGLAFYWGEGSKKSRLSFINSDPEAILFMYKWFQKILNVKKEEFAPRIFINEIHRPRSKKLLDFWASLLKLPSQQFCKVVFLKQKQKKIYENYDDYYGVLALQIRKSTNLKYKIMGLIEALKKSA